MLCFYNRYRGTKEYCSNEASVRIISVPKPQIRVSKCEPFADLCQSCFDQKFRQVWNHKHFIQAPVSLYDYNQIFTMELCL